jgi:hypothetical protein
MKVTLDPKTTIEVKADKGLYFKGKKVASFEKNVLQLTEMKDNMSVWKDGSVTTSPASPVAMKLNDKDELEFGNGGKISIDDKGKVTLVPATDKKPEKPIKVTITGFKPEARRAAELTVIFGLMSMAGEVKTTTAVSTPAEPPKGGATPPKGGATPPKPKK